MFPGSTQAQIDPWLKSTRYLRETYSQCFSNYSIIDKRSTPKFFDETGITLIQNQANSQKPRKKPIRGKKNLQWKGFIFLTLPCHSSWSKVLSGREDATKLPLDGRKRLLQQKRWAKDPQCGYIKHVRHDLVLFDTGRKWLNSLPSTICCRAFSNSKTNTRGNMLCTEFIHNPF